MPSAAHNPSQDAGDDQGFTGPIETLIPRIDIESFCTTGPMATAIQESAYDRRMARTSIAVAMGGTKRAIEIYEESATPHLLIIETDQIGLEVFDELEALANVCDPDTKVIVCGPSNDVTLYRELKRQGVDEYIVSPAAPIQIIEAIATVFAEPGVAPMARTIGFVGVKGGCGASTLAHNAAWKISRTEEKEVMLIDLDIQFGTANLDFDREPTRTVLDALASTEPLDEVKLQRLLIEYDDYLSILAAPSSLEAQTEFDENTVVDMIETIRGATDFAVFDIPHTWTPWVQRSVMQMEEIVLVATPELASLRNLKAFYDLLVSRRPNDNPPRIVLNQVGVPKRPEIAADDVAEIIGREVDLIIPYDPTLFGEASNSGQMVEDANPKHEIVTLLGQLCDTVTASRTSLKKAGRSKAGKGKGFDLGKFISMLKKKRPSKARKEETAEAAAT